MADIIQCADTRELIERGACEIAGAMAAAVAASGRCRIALAGGATPAPIYRRLAEEPLRSTVAWDCIEVFWGDERLVPADDAASNFRMARESLLAHVPIDERHVHPIPTGAGAPQAIADAYENELRIVGGATGSEPPRLDVVLLGLGDDGHTASLFPHSAALRERRRWVVPTRSPHPPTDRITLTYPVLNHAAVVMFLVQGESKAPILREVLGSQRDPERWPAQGVEPRGRLMWLVDAAAARDLRRSS